MESKGSQKAAYGFIVWIMTILGMTIYVFWSSLPEWLLHRIQFTYYPDRYWAVGIPAVLIGAYYYYTSTYFLLYMRNTKKLTDLHCITDGDAKSSVRHASLGPLAEVKSSVPPIADIPVSVTSSLFYLPWT